MKSHLKAKTKKEDRRRALVVGPCVGSAREFARSLFLAGIDPAHLAREIRVAVDGGLSVFQKAGWRPHFAVGDWDSLHAPHVKTALKGIFHLTLPKNKDRSDLYYACRAALSTGANDLVCVGVTGGRPDHHLATLLDLSEISQQNDSLLSLVAVDQQARFHFLSENRSEWSATLRPGQTVSVFALGGEARGVTLQGFKYPLRNAVLNPSSHGLSNCVKEAHCRVQVKKGRLVIVVLETT